MQAAKGESTVIPSYRAYEPQPAQHGKTSQEFNTGSYILRVTNDHFVGLKTSCN